MTKFQVGDRVRFDTSRYVAPHRISGEGVVTEVGRITAQVSIDGPQGDSFPYYYGELTVVEPELKFKVGDRVRVTVEGEFFEETDTWLGLNGVAVLKDTDGVDILNVEKVEPPVEKFGAGDVVRDIGPDSIGQVFLITSTGYVQVKPHIGQHHEWGPMIGHGEEFTSESYEKVNLAEVPF